MSIVGPVINQNFIPTTRVLQKRTNQSSSLANIQKLATVKLDEGYILPFERPQKRQRRASSIGASQPSVKLIPNTPLKAKLGRRNKSVSLSSIKTGLFNDGQRDIQPVGCTAEAHFKDGVSMNWDSQCVKA